MGLGGPIRSFVTIFYGEMGSGKSYTAAKYANDFGLDFYEGDDAVTPEMQRYVLNRPIPKRVIEDFLYNHFVPAVAARAVEGGNLVVAQALYRREHRDQVHKRLAAMGHLVEFRLVKVPVWRNLKQLFGRKLGTFWVLYWLLNHPFFQEGDGPDE